MEIKDHCYYQASIFQILLGHESFGFFTKLSSGNQESLLLSGECFFSLLWQMSVVFTEAFGILSVPVEVTQCLAISFFVNKSTTTKDVFKTNLFLDLSQCSIKRRELTWNFYSRQICLAMWWKCPWTPSYRTHCLKHTNSQDEITIMKFFLKSVPLHRPTHFTKHSPIS